MDTDFLTGQVKIFLDSYGWKYDTQGQNELITRFQGENSNTEFHLIIGVGENWVALTIWPFLFPFPPEKELEALKEICKRNFDLKMARLGMTSKGEVTLCIDFPADELTESLFHHGLDVMTYYADNLYPDFVKFWGKN